MYNLLLTIRLVETLYTRALAFLETPRHIASGEHTGRHYYYIIECRRSFNKNR